MFTFYHCSCVLHFTDPLFWERLEDEEIIAVGQGKEIRKHFALLIPKMPVWDLDYFFCLSFLLGFLTA